MAVAAHPDDIEFLMAGTLLLLKDRGFEIHYMTLSSGNCGSESMNSGQTRKARRAESKAAARVLGATHHLSITDDLEIFYDLKLLRKLAAVMREVAPEILLIPSPQDYMEDHVNTCRLAVTAAFARGMPNFKTTPARKPIAHEVALYHAMPHGLRDPLRQPIVPELLVNTASTHERKRAALAEHRSQKEWLDVSQGMDSYLLTMDEMSLAMGRASRKFKHAEGWRRHLHLGFSSVDRDVLSDALGKDCRRNGAYPGS